MHFWKRKEKNTSGKRKVRRRYTLAFCPDDVAGWLRIPSMIMWLTGLLGIVKYTSLPASVLLKSFNLPCVEFCWLMLGIGGTVYLLSLAYWLFVENVARTCRPYSSAAAEDSSQWRSL